MSITHCSRCGRPFYDYRRRCPHCQALREDLTDAPYYIRQPISLLLVAMAITGLMLLWSLFDDRPTYASPPAEETPRTQTRVAPGEE
ncbi:hypothetical protein C7H85_04590 [Zobellella endophytica]|uniref:Uncharacterized protein n=1 Tax=Zobellella endophytica TaxID=2116700 RepID=A0A2P7RCY6_9GAMM|nr:hypothetical protein [Zobellella endophytica]PSJ48069.1 hypothetical protein C7H85_04590 [Zobellella endophytica]